MKKFLLIILSAISVFSVAGCKAKTTEKKPKGDYKIAFLGDSLTDKGVYSEQVTNHYTDYVYDNASFVSGIQNVGYAGSCIAGLPNKAGVNPSFTQRYSQIDSDANVV